jgi:polyribonucleotide nucleotidyltransferase
MNEALATPRADLSAHAPRITQIKVKPDQIRTIIGPGGKMIKAIVDQTGCAIDIEDDGTVAIASPDNVSVQKAIDIIKSLTMTPEVGETYKAKVTRVEPYGAFLEFAPGKDGLLHVSEIDWNRVESVEDYMRLGDEVDVKIIEVDRDGRVRFSRKALLPKPEGYVEREPSGSGGGGGAGGGGGRRDSGGRGGPPRRDRGDRPRR